jgi:AcrR family transcriptional regulator
MTQQAPKPELTKRKSPVQQRSRQTVAVILEATTQVLVARGYESTTTGAVAERAGVSIGTLYQYFPNKASLVAALIEQHVREVLSMVETALQQSAAAGPEQTLKALVRASLDAHRVNPALHKVLAEQVPREGHLGQVMDVSAQIAARLQAHFVPRLPQVPRPRIRILAFVLESTIEALTHRAVIDGPQWLSNGQLEQEAIALLEPYLRNLIAGAAGSGQVRAPVQLSMSTAQ